MAHELVTRAEAREKGLTRYYTGQPCKHGHLTLRVVSNGACLECVGLINKKYQKKDPEHFKELRRATETRYRDSHREKMREKWRRFEANASEERKASHKVWDKKWRDANSEKNNARINAWKAAHPDLVAKYAKRWRDANLEKLAAKNKRYKELHKERLAPIAVARTKQWMLDNPERAAELRANVARNRRARKKANGVYVSVKEVAFLLQLQRNKCGYCEVELTKENRELDHFYAVARGGPHIRSNLIWSCIPCNRSKAAKDPWEWLASRGRLPWASEWLPSQFVAA